MANMNIKTEKILSPSNIRRIIMLGISIRDQLENAEKGLISDYDSTQTYTRGQAVYYNNYLYKCLYTTTGDFDESKWQLIGDDLDLLTLDDIKALINLSDEEIASLQSLISTEIRLDKCFSSSDTYNRLLTVENECKKFTLEQLAKKAGVVYKIVADTTGVDSTEFLYLIPNGSNGYNIYAYIDGSAVKISDTNINLDGYAKLSDLNNYYDKATSDSKFATITTVDGKVDKTSILTTISSTPSDDKLLSEKAIKTELDTINTNLDDKVNKASITDTIDSTSTSTDIASAKGVYDFKNYTIINYPDLRANNTITVFSDILKLMPINKTWYIVNFKEESLSTADEIEKFGFPTNMNAWGNIQITCKQRFDTMQSYYIELQTDGNSQFTYRWLGECTSVKSGDVEAYAIQWKMLCSTSVADIPLKKLVNSTDIKSDAVINYMVKNGMCTVSINTLSSSKMSTGNITLTTGLPIPFNTSCWYSICTNSNATTAPLQNLLLRIDSTGNLIAYKGTDNVNYFGTFTYPVRKDSK